MPDPSHIFNRTRVRLHRDRAARAPEQTEFLLTEMASRLCERLEDFTRGFPVALDLGAHHGVFAKTLGKRAGVEVLVQSDLSEAMARANPSHAKLVADEEWLPFAENSFDLVVSIGSLHWVNDLPGTLVQVKHILKPDGMFIAMLPGGETLKELRQSLEQAEITLSGGVSPRVSPFIDAQSGAGLLQRAGFAMPVSDSEMIEVHYTHPLKLMHDLQHMGESNALLSARKNFTPCSLMMTAADHYLRHFSDDSGRVTASFELVTLTGWKPV